MVSIDLLDSIKVTDEDKSLFVTFSYNPEILAKIKEIKPRYWHFDIKAWEYPQASIHKLIEVIGEDNVCVDKDINLEYIKPVFEVSEGEPWTIFNPVLAKMMSDVAEYTVFILKKVPAYFFTVPASSSGRYHPSYASGEGGLARHSLALGLIGLTLYENNTICGQFTNREKSLMLSAEMLHDVAKHGFGDGGKTLAEHPLLASKFIMELEQDILSKEEVGIISGCIETHMGEWNRDYKQKTEIMNKPFTEMQKFVHMCDYLASRKLLEVNFDVVE